jgi:hypothetical protein
MQVMNLYYHALSHNRMALGYVIVIQALIDLAKLDL